MRISGSNNNNHRATFMYETKVWLCLHVCVYVCRYFVESLSALSFGRAWNWRISKRCTGVAIHECRMHTFLITMHADTGMRRREMSEMFAVVYVHVVCLFAAGLCMHESKYVITCIRRSQGVHISMRWTIQNWLEDAYTTASTHHLVREEHY